MMEPSELPRCSKIRQGSGDVFEELSQPTVDSAAQHSVRQNALLESKVKTLSPTGGLIKRVIDILVASISLIVLFPLMMVVAALIACTSKGPILFWSWRIGYLGKAFQMPKFRTLYVNAPVKSRESLGDADTLYTPIGKFLRRSSMDELPQFWSILIGDMSLIGPRPLLMNDSTTTQRLNRPLSTLSRPGITGLAQINGRNHLASRKKVSYDVAYARLWSWRLESRIVVETVRYVLTGRGIL
tara:strand:- start:554 stop:1279 length:726 start_codon:yes stop_codon:yes gene_type:complete